MNSIQFKQLYRKKVLLLYKKKKKKLTQKFYVQINTFGDWNRQIQRQALMLFSSLYSSEKWAPSPLPALPNFSPYSFTYKEGGAPMWTYATCELSLPSPPPLSPLIPLSKEPAHHQRDTITFHMLGSFLQEITNTALLYFITHIEMGPIQKVSSENHHIGFQWVRGPAPTQLQPLKTLDQKSRWLALTGTAL